MIPNCKRTNEKEVFYWDGKSSTDNPDNIALWQEIVNRCLNENKSCLVFTQLPNDTDSYKSNRGIFIIDNQVLHSDYNVIDGITELSISMSISSSDGAGMEHKFIRAVVEMSESTVTNIEKVAFSNRTTVYRFLPTNTNKITSYTPTYDYHPATKKYVDDTILNAITSALEVSY